MIATKVARVAAALITSIMPLGMVACDGGMSSLFEKQYSIADQVAAAENAWETFTPVPEPANVVRVAVSEAAELSLTPMFTVGDGRNGHPLRLGGFVPHILPLRSGRMALHDKASQELHIIDSAGQLLGTQPALVPSPDLLSSVLRRERYLDDLVSRGDTIIALGTTYSRGMQHSLGLLVSGKPELDKYLVQLDIDRFTGEASLLGVTDSLDVFVHKLVSRSGARNLTQPQHTIRRIPGATATDSAALVLQYTRADSLLSINDGGKVFRPIFSASVASAFSDGVIFLARDTTPRIELFDKSGASIRTVLLDVARVAATPEAFERRRSAIFDDYASLDSALKTSLAQHPYPAQQPVISALFASPDGQLMVLRQDLGWDAPAAEQQHVFDIFDASFRHVGRGRLSRAENIKLFRPPMICTSHQQPPLPDSERMSDDGIHENPRGGLVTCYRITT